MNVANIIFAKIKILGLLPVVVAITAFPAFAADNGCNNTANNRITPALALCSTHAYNIGQTENPTAAADKQAMRDVIALKSTVIMQQMKKQYDYLDATISRLKTQLEREILTTNLLLRGRLRLHHHRPAPVIEIFIWPVHQIVIMKLQPAMFIHVCVIIFI